MTANRKKTDRKKPSSTSPDRTKEEPGRSVEEDPAVERGERIATGKQIARGGKTSGDVDGATEREHDEP